MKLLDDELPLHWLEGETLYSLVCRYHRLSGHAASGATTKALFGSSNPGHADVPTGLGEICARTHGTLGTLEKVATQRTVFSYFRRFMSRDDNELAISLMAGERGQVAAARAVMRMNSRVQPLRACRDCIRSDMATKGVCCWHLIHQLPLTYICLQHGTDLLHSDVLGRASWLGRWRLPDECDLQTLPLPVGRPTIKKWAETAGQIATSSESPLLHADLLLGGYASRAAELRASELPSDFRAVVQAVVHTPSATSLARLTSEMHVALISNAFGSWGEFLQWSRQNKAAPSLSRPTKKAVAQHQVLCALGARSSISAAAAAANVDVTTAQIWGAAHGTSFRPRPSKLHPDLRVKATLLLENGADKPLVAREAGISVVTVTKLLGTVRDLRSKWTKVRVTQAVETAKKDLLELVEASPALGAKACRQFEPAAYGLLYRRDRPWLIQFLAGRPINSTVRPQTDDDVLAQRVRTAAATVSGTVTDRPNAASLLLALPELAEVAHQISSLPNTANEVTAALSMLRTNTQIELPI